MDIFFRWKKKDDHRFLFSMIQSAYLWFIVEDGDDDDEEKNY